MIAEAAMPRTRKPRQFTLSPDDADRLERIAALRTAGNASQAVALALELADLVLREPAALAGLDAADILARYRQARPDPTRPGGSR